eukprot:3998257-Pyramimonas_sp.AAC.1
MVTSIRTESPRQAALAAPGAGCERVVPLPEAASMAAAALAAMAAAHPPALGTSLGTSLGDSQATRNF